MSAENLATDTVEYWRKGNAVQNFGDFLSEYFVERLFLGVSRRRYSVHLIGSVIDNTRVMEAARLRAAAAAAGRTPEVGRVVFWGCGARDANGLAPQYRAHAEILAVRGPLTRAVLGLGEDVPAADPGFLLPQLYAPRAATAGEGTVCMPHFHDRRTDEELIRLSGCATVVRSNISGTAAAVEAVIDALAGSRFVLTASLHGAVAAAAYGRPFAFWNSGSVDVPFKWQDLAASMGIPCEFASRLEDGERIYSTAIASALRIPALWPLLATAPFAIRPVLAVRVIAADVRRHGAGVLEQRVATQRAEALLAGDVELPPPAEPTKPAHFYAKDAETRRELTQAAIAQKSTLVERWVALPAEGTEGWKARARLAAELVAGEPAVVDLGCGMMYLETYLAPGTRYLPADVVARDARTMVLDLNAQPLPKLDSDCIVACGLLEYIHEVPKLLDAMARQYRVVLISYNPLDTVPDIAGRQGHAWVNNFKAAELEAAFAQAGLQIVAKRPHGQQLLWKLVSRRFTAV